MGIICFHNPDEPNGYLSNWWYSSFIVNGITFNSSEQYMMYCKAITFGDMETAQQILKTRSFSKMKALGRAVQGYDDSVWSSVRYNVVKQGVLQKFIQNPELAHQLISTGDNVLAECAVKDRIWAIGLSMTDPKRFDIGSWRGQNLLGKILMEVREELRSMGFR